MVSVDYVISTDITGAPEELLFSSLVINIFIILGLNISALDRTLLVTKYAVRILYLS